VVRRDEGEAAVELSRALLALDETGLVRRDGVEIDRVDRVVSHTRVDRDREARAWHEQKALQKCALDARAVQHLVVTRGLHEVTVGDVEAPRHVLVGTQRFAREAGRVARHALAGSRRR
jgi:hypothetical protein